MDSKGLIPGQPWSFEDAIKRAITSCQQSGNTPDHHFAGAGKEIPGVSCLGSTYSIYPFARVRKLIIFGKTRQNSRGVKGSLCGRAQNDIWVKIVRDLISFV